MGSKTANYGWNKIESPSDKLSDENFKVLGADRDDMDERVHQIATHHHSGGSAVVGAPASPLELALSTISGALAPSTTYYYRQTWIDAFGHESLSSDQNSITTPDPVVDPDAPDVTTQGLGGVLASGDYYYVLSAYAPDANRETLASNVAVVTAGAGSTNKNIVTLPDLPDGADGFNLYRRVPSGTGFFLLATIPMDVATPPSEYEDDGSVAANAERTLPVANTTNIDLSIEVCIGGATPVVPPSYLWRIYRTAVPDNWVASRLRTIADGSVCYIDKGLATTAGAPPTQDDPDAPDKIELTDAAEVQGSLPPANLAYFDVIEFAFPGPLEVRDGTFIWRCQYDEFYIQYVTANLGDGSLAVGDDDVFDVLWQDNNAATPMWVSLFDQATPVLPFIAVGEQVADEFTPVHRTLLKGDFLRAAVTQVSDAATPTDADLLIQIVGYGKMSTTASVVFP
jgi:hypothetical protein